MGNVDYFFLDYFRRKKLNKILKKVNKFASEISKLTDSDLKNKTNIFKDMLQKGYSLDDILPEAYAVVREAAKRVLGMYPYDVQVLGAIVLHQGNVAEMKTGEGKTLTATMPLYLNALTGKGAIIVTTNDYLAKRDYDELADLYRFLGLTVSTTAIGEDRKIKPKEKRKIYSADIVYTTNSTLGFDYLQENLADSTENKFLWNFNYVIIDEVDEVLLDNTQTPLIISGSPRAQSNLYKLSNTFVLTLKEKEDYKYDKEKNEVWLTYKGVDRAEQFFAIDNLYSPEYTELARHIVLALRAHKLFEKDKEYVVQGDELHLLDNVNGRILENTKIQSGQHQALETKEYVKLSDDTRAIASITYQNLFKMFKKISGMTGTGKTSENEFIDTYNMAVIQIPTNKPMVRRDLEDAIYCTLPEKLYASLNMLLDIHKTGQPVLLVTGSVDMSEIYSKMLLQEGIAHNVLNAYNIAKEADIIKEAGQKGAVTVATILAGRGTDIKLGEGVAELGGLAVIGTEKMMSKRFDLQLIGRSGRQGDPGFSKFFVSLEDKVVTKYGADKLKEYYKKNKDNFDFRNPVEIKNKKIRKLINKAQQASSNYGESSRKTTLEFDESIRVQRDLVYKYRNKIISENIDDKYVYSMIEKSIVKFIKNINTEDDLTFYILENLSYDFKGFDGDFDFSDEKVKMEILFNIINFEVTKKKNLLGSKINEFYRLALLKAIDECWIEQVDNLQQLKSIVMGRETAQKQVMFEYYIESKKSFDKMKLDIEKEIIRNISLSNIEVNNKQELMVYFP
ncbi:accessory Sec system translocase SecA2 [Gemella sp. GH3]|uniref:accessory Sec system translocase SecA2 n=1 Tax=unclassified Gemella TaxID=2624949 RepID=UPI0015CFC7BB|nr:MULTISPECIES: accessory Sec system translocase SecA2 [unclassified Gemella]MBF0714048.1 accessory Sec system translocase SecA2 [Gemella sp. GH3.1]NYS51000.1 accessory Sec system translocase SecA2 [Gemella sp. GH3]